MRRWHGPPLFEEKKVLTLLLVHLGLTGTRCGAKGFSPAQSAHTYSDFFSSLLVRSPILACSLACSGGNYWRRHRHREGKEEAENEASASAAHKSKEQSGKEKQLSLSPSFPLPPPENQG